MAEHCMGEGKGVRAGGGGIAPLLFGQDTLQELIVFYVKFLDRVFGNRGLLGCSHTPTSNSLA